MRTLTYVIFWSMTAVIGTMATMTFIKIMTHNIEVLTHVAGF